MSTDQDHGPVAPDYDLDNRCTVTDQRSIRAMFHPLRGTILDLLLERAATVKELSVAIGRPTSTIAYHTDVLADADLIRVVRTRKVRAVTERFYGRTARTFVVGVLNPDVATSGPSPIKEAAAEAEPAHRGDHLRAIHRRTHIPADQAEAFWQQVLDLAGDFAALARSGTDSYAFVAGLYPTDFPTLPAADPTTASPSGD
jgi:DNA-binding transcriptional ArsR family regulator